MDSILNLGNFLENSIDSGLGKIQNSFLQTSLGSVVDKAVNAGLKVILPDFIEDQIIDVKDTILQDGVKAGINEAISSSIDLGKSVIGIFTGKFENVSQIQSAVKKGGLIDAVSSVLDKAIDTAVNSGIIDKSVGKIISSGKKSIIKSVSDNIKNNIETQVTSIEKIDNYCKDWNTAYNNQDLNQMEKIYNKINKQLDNIVPLETIINKAREIENLYNLIKNNGGDFNISKEQIALAQVL